MMSTSAATSCPSCRNVLFACSSRERPAPFPLARVDCALRAERRRASHCGRLLMEVAAARAAVAERVEGRLLLCGRCPARDRSGRRRRSQGGRPRAGAGSPGSCRAAISSLRSASARDAAQQTDGVRVARVGEDLARDRPPRPAGRRRGRRPARTSCAITREVVADEEDARAELLAQRGDELEHLRLDGRVEARGRLVEDEERRVLRERHRDDDPLLHPSGELVGIAAHDPRRDRRSAPSRASRCARSTRLASVGAQEPEDLGDLRRRRGWTGSAPPPGSGRPSRRSSRAAGGRPRSLIASRSSPLTRIEPETTRPFRGR